MTAWQRFDYSFGSYEYEYDESGYTGWYREVDGPGTPLSNTVLMLLAHTVERNYKTGETR